MTTVLRTRSKSPQVLPLPPFFDPANAAEWNYEPDQAKLFLMAVDWALTHKIPPMAADDASIVLMLIDLQKDFCHPKGSLYVAGRQDPKAVRNTGAIEDNVRLARFIYLYLMYLSQIRRTFDTHFANQIFFASHFKHGDGTFLSPHTLVDVNDKGNLVNIGLDGKVIDTEVRVNPNIAHWLANGNLSWLEQQDRHYCRELKRPGKRAQYTLYLWPFHCLLGSQGHASVGVVHEASFFHAWARDAQSEADVKGTHPLSERYGVFAEEVMTRWDGKALVQKDPRPLQTMMKHKKKIFAGQAGSHCDKATIGQFLDEILAQDPDMASSCYILRDCMSAVTVPDGKGGYALDCTKDMEVALDEFSRAGMHVVDSTTPMWDWPGMNDVF